MATLSTFTYLTLDGVMQAPGRPDEDTRGGFPYGGWGSPYADEVMASVAGSGMSREGALLFGRRTYEDFASVWPHRTDGNPFTDVLNRRQKYLASTTLREPLPWVNSTLLAGDVPEAVARLKDAATDIMILGSGELIGSLMPRGLIDEFVLRIHPLVLGTGRRLFADGGTYATLRLADSTVTTTGVIIATYRPA